MQGSPAALVVSIAISLGGAAAATAQCLVFESDVVDGAGGAALDGALGVEVAPDGQSVYVTAAAEDALAVFARDPATGATTFHSALRDGIGGADGLLGPQGIGTSLDGKHVYVAGEDGLAVFAEQSGSIQLGFVELHGSAEVLDGTDVVVSPDGKHVYVADPAASRIAIYARSAATGALTHLGAFEDGQQGAPLASVWDVAIAPDGAQVYATARSDSALVWFDRDAATGLLSLRGYAVDGSNGVVDGLDTASNVAVSPDGRHVYVTGQLDQAIAVFASDGDSLAFQEVVKDGIGDVDLQYPMDLAVSPDGLRLVVKSSSSDDPAADGMAVFARDPSTGSLRQAETRRDGAAPEDHLDGVTGVAVSPDGRSVYATSFSEDALTVYRWPELLRETQVLRDGLGGVEGLDNSGSVAASPDRRFLYVSGFEDDAIAVFERDPRSGTLSFVEFERNGLGGVSGMDGPSDLAISPDGKHLYAAALTSGAVVVFARNATTGALGFVQNRRDGFGGVDGIGGAGTVLVSPDGEHVYVGGYGDGAVALFARDAGTGGLDFVSAIFDGEGGADGLAGAGGGAMAMDDEGRHLYVPGSNESALTVFERDAASGTLAWVQTLRDDVGSISDLGFAFASALSPDGSRLYVTALGDDALLSFVRDPELGILDPLEVERNGSDGVTDLVEPRGIALGPGGRRVWVAAQSSDAMAGFAYDPAFGSTTFAGSLANANCLPFLDGASDPVAIGRWIYVASAGSDALVVLAPEPGDGVQRALAAAAALAALGATRRRA